jgi:hypothetical protein
MPLKKNLHAPKEEIDSLIEILKMEYDFIKTGREISPTILIGFLTALLVPLVSFLFSPQFSPFFALFFAFWFIGLYIYLFSPFIGKPTKLQKILLYLIEELLYIKARKNQLDPRVWEKVKSFLEKRKSELEGKGEQEIKNVYIDLKEEIDSLIFPTHKYEKK